MYKTLNSKTVMRLVDGACIPSDPANADYQRYLADVAAGAEVQQASAPSPQVSARAALAQLEQATMMNKGMREFFLVSMQDMAIRKAEQMVAAGIEATPQAILADTPAWVKLVLINTQAHALELEANA